MTASEFQLRREVDGTYRQLPLDAPPSLLKDGDVLVRPYLVGICGSDLMAHTECANLGACFGHEWLGEVIGFGSAVRSFALGDRATSGAFIGCCDCDTCGAGRSNLCPRATILGNGALGAARSWMVLPEAELVRAPGYMRDSGILLEPGSVAVAVQHALENVGTRERDVAIVGAGAIGLLTALLLQESGARVTLIDRCDSRLEAAREIGARAVDARDDDRLRALERTFPVLVDCAHGRNGGRGGWDYVPGLVRRGGVVIAVAKYPKGAMIDLEPLARAGLTVTWLRGAPRTALAEAAAHRARLLHDRHRWLVSDEFPAASIDRALEHALDTSKSRKVTLRLDG